jgi:hypothetical protein
MVKEVDLVAKEFLELFPSGTHELECVSLEKRNAVCLRRIVLIDNHPGSQLVCDERRRM